MARALFLPPRMIRLRGVEKCYDLGGGKVWVLRRIDLEVKEGEFISIMGPSGAGKSTLLHVLGMHDSAWTGEYYLLDQPVHALDKKRRAELQKKIRDLSAKRQKQIDAELAKQPKPETDKALDEALKTAVRDQAKAKPLFGSGASYTILCLPVILPSHAVSPGSSCAGPCPVAATSSSG